MAQPKSRDLARAFFRASYSSISPAEAERFAEEMLNPDRARETLKLLAEHVPFPLTARRVLEIGSGVGMFVLVARQDGVRAFGVEPYELGSQAARYNLTEHGVPQVIARAAGEALPYADSSFDVVCSFQVLEHVIRPDAVLAETVRVLKPGGVFVHVFPNYGSVWEGHYGIPWIPHLPKRLGRLYVRLLGRDTAMFDDLQLLSHGSMAKLARRHRTIAIVGWGFDVWERRVRTLNFSEWAYLGRLKRAVQWAHRLRLIELVVRLGRLAHLETPIILVGIKR
jgi:SAM-dependent methyltransferase